MTRIFTGLCLLIIPGCAWLPGHSLPPPDPPLTILVGPVTLDAPVTSPSDLATFEETPSSDVAPQLLKQLIDEVEMTAQRLLTEELARQPGFRVIPFQDARRLQTNRSAEGTPLDAEDLWALGQEVHADLVVSGRLVDYGVVRWQYWVSGLLVSMLTETLIVGAATGFNPAAMAATAASELLTDLPVWWGGAYIAGWAFRPVRLKTEAWEVRTCVEKPWKEEAVVVLIPGWTLKKREPDERRRKEVQLTVNLIQAVKEIADNAGKELRLSPCTTSEQDRRKGTPL